MLFWSNYILKIWCPTSLASLKIDFLCSGQAGEEGTQGLKGRRDSGTQATGRFRWQLMYSRPQGWARVHSVPFLESVESHSLSSENLEGTMTWLIWSCVCFLLQICLWASQLLGTVCIFKVLMIPSSSDTFLTTWSQDPGHSPFPNRPSELTFKAHCPPMGVGREALGALQPAQGSPLASSVLGSSWEILVLLATWSGQPLCPPPLTGIGRTPQGVIRPEVWLRRLPTHPPCLGESRSLRPELSNLTKPPRPQDHQWPHSQDPLPQSHPRRVLLTTGVVPALGTIALPPPQVTTPTSLQLPQQRTLKVRIRILQGSLPQLSLVLAQILYLLLKLPFFYYPEISWSSAL